MTAKVTAHGHVVGSIGRTVVEQIAWPFPHRSHDAFKLLYRYVRFLLDLREMRLLIARAFGDKCRLEPALLAHLL